MKKPVRHFTRSFYWVLLAIHSMVGHAALADDYVVELYDTYCSACHSNKGTGAPMAFAPEQWNTALAKGAEQLVNNAITGVGNMPAQGGCMECAYEDFEDLVNYMTSAKAQ